MEEIKNQINQFYKLLTSSHILSHILTFIPMSWNNFPKLQPLLIDSIASSFQTQALTDPQNIKPSPLESPLNQFNKTQTPKIIDLSSSNEDKFKQLLNKIQKVTHDFQEDHSFSPILNSTFQQTGLSFRHTMKSLKGEKNLSKSTRRARNIKNINNSNDEGKQFNKLFSQTSSFEFLSTQNKSRKFINIKPKEQNKISAKFTEPIHQLHKEYVYNQQNQRIFSLKSSQQTQHSQTFKNIKKINFDEKILQKVPIRQSIHLDQLENLQETQNYIFRSSAKDQLKFSDFQLGNCIGSGKFGQVYVCRHKKTNFVCALKKIMKSTIQEYKMVDQFIRQLKISYMVDHPNVIKTYGHFHDQFHMFLLMQYAGDGCLIDNLQYKKSEQFSAKVLFQTLNAIEHLHRNKIVHRDLKPENIVVFFKDTFKLCDFGLSAFVDNQMKHTFCGTPDYLSPEMKDTGEYDFSVDLWSLGVLAYELVTGEAPFKDKISEWKKSGWKKSIYWTWKVQYPKFMSCLAKDFMEGLLKEKPHQRASIRSCLRHEFIKKDSSKEIDIIKMAQISD